MILCCATFLDALVPLWLADPALAYGAHPCSGVSHVKYRLLPEDSLLCIGDIGALALLVT
jgi:hypothetical protein